MRGKGEWKPSKRQPALPPAENAGEPAYPVPAAAAAPVPVAAQPSFLGVVFQPAFWKQVWTEWSEHRKHHDDGDLMGAMMLEFMSQRDSEFAPGAACISGMIAMSPVDEFLKMAGHLVPAELRWIFEGKEGETMYAGVQRRLRHDFTQYVCNKADCLAPEIHKVVHETVRAWNMAQLKADLRPEARP